MRKAPDKTAAFAVGSRVLRNPARHRRAGVVAPYDAFALGMDVLTYGNRHRDAETASPTPQS